MARSPSTPAPLAALGHYIAGRFVRPRHPPDVIERRNPGDTRDVVGAFPCAGADAVDAAVVAARAAQPAWARLPPARREAVLLRLRRRLDARAADMARLIVREVGRPLWDADNEVRRLRGRIDVTLEDALPDVATRVFAEPRGRLVHRPLGVFVVLGPYNFPANLIHGHVVPALLTGNTVVVKPSELAPAVGQLYARIVDEAGLPPGVFNLVQGDARTGAALVAHDDVDGVLFTGSFRAGSAIERAALRTRKLVALEMGGRNACVVFKDADVRTAVREVVLSAFASSGQRCSAGSRLLVHRRLAEEVTARVVATASRLTVGYGFDDDVFMGPLASAPGQRRFMARVAAAERAGLIQALLPGGRVERRRPGFYVAPSVHRLLRRDFSSAYLADELFGPNLVIDVFDDLEEAVAQANATPFGLCLGVFTRGERTFREMLLRGRAGVVNWNRGTIGGAARMPFGGLGRSGNHRAGGSHTIRSCVIPVAVQEGDARAFDPRSLPPGFPV